KPEGKIDRRGHDEDIDDSVGDKDRYAQGRGVQPPWQGEKKPQECSQSKNAAACQYFKEQVIRINVRIPAASTDVSAIFKPKIIRPDTERMFTHDFDGRLPQRCPRYGRRQNAGNPLPVVILRRINDAGRPVSAPLHVHLNQQWNDAGLAEPVEIAAE